MRIQALAFLAFAACSSDSGSAPEIANLTYSPMTVTTGQASVVTGSITFADTDGDLAQLGAEVTLPDASKQSLPMTDLRGVGDMTEGTLAFQLSFVPPAAGAYRFALFITDDGDHESNRLEGTITAQ